MTCLLVGPSLSQTRNNNGTYAIRNAKIVTVTGATIERGNVVIKDGKITAVGANASIPGNATVVDGTGLSVYPGLIDANTILGLTEIGSVSGTNDTNELGDFNPNMKAMTAVNPGSELIPVARMNGVTTVVTCPRGGIISGQCALFNLDGWTNAEMQLKSPAAFVINYPTLSAFGRGNFFSFGQEVTEQQRKLREQRIDALHKKLEDAQAYAKAKEAEAKDKNLPPRTVDLGLEALIPVVKGEVPVVIAAEELKEIKAAVELADKFKLKLIISGGDDAIKIAPTLKEKNISVLLGPVLAVPGSADDGYDASYARAGELSNAGVKVAFSTGDASNVRLLPYHAGTSAAFGLSKEEALKGVTIYPAQMFGVDKLVGSIEPGKIANIVVTDGDILEFKTRVKHMFINGQKVDPNDNKHTKLYEKYKDRK